jgi:hypothetical protein
MHRSMSRRLLAASLLALLAVASRAAPPDGLAGRWVLAEQTYGKGGSNLAARAPDLRLDVAVDLERTEVKIWSGGDAALALPWPAVVAEGASAELQVLEKTVDAGAGSLRTRYRIRPPTDDGLTLDVVEVYTLDVKGDALNGTVTVEMSLRGEPRGGFVLHRRFVREPR